MHNVKLTSSCAWQLRKDTYSRLTPVQRLQVARHPNRPTFLDIALNISDKFVELHGDRAGLDDPAMVCGLASMEGQTFMFIGHQKGRNTKVSMQRCLLCMHVNGCQWLCMFCICCETSTSHVAHLRETSSLQMAHLPGSAAGEHPPQLWYASAQWVPESSALHEACRQVWPAHCHICGHPWRFRWQVS